MSTETSRAQPKHGQASILLVDDTPGNLSVLSDWLQPEYRVLCRPFRAPCSHHRQFATTSRSPVSAFLGCFDRFADIAERYSDSEAAVAAKHAALIGSAA